MRSLRNGLLLLFFLVGALMIALDATYFSAAKTAPSSGLVTPIGKIVEIQVPLGLPPVPIPTDNPPTAETIALGRRLYYDSAVVCGWVRFLRIVPCTGIWLL